MIQCPKCANNLPDWAQVCQFCQTDLKGVARPKTPDPATRRPYISGPAPWVWPVYYICAAWFIFNGLTALVAGIVMMTNLNKSPIGQMFVGFSYIAMVVGVIQIVIGLGLIIRNEFIRGVANIWCWLQIAVSLLGLAGAVFGGGFFTLWGIIGIVRGIFDITTAGLIIYLIGETD